MMKKSEKIRTGEWKLWKFKKNQKFTTADKYKANWTIGKAFYKVKIANEPE